RHTRSDRDWSSDVCSSDLNIFNLLCSAHTNSELLAVERELAPLKAKHWDTILMNEALFHRVEAVYQMQFRVALSAEERCVLERRSEERRVGKECRSRVGRA